MLKRKVTVEYDGNPRRIHYFNYETIKKYIQDKKVLDIGCWTGQLEKLVINDVGEITGIDPEPNAIIYAKANIPKAKFIIGSANKLPFAKKSFDVVTLLDVIEHVSPKTEKNCFNQINKVLKKNGILALSTPNKHIISILLDPAYFLLGHRHYSIRELKTLLEQTGFIAEQIIMVGGTIHLLEHLFELFQKHFLHTRVHLPKKINKLIDKSCSPGGFAEIYLIARKVKEL